MDFFAQQDRARKKTKWLVLYFSMAVILIIAAIYFIVLFVSFYFGVRQHDYRHEYQPFSWWDAKIFLGAAVGSLAVIFGGSAYKIHEFAEGGSAVAESLGGRLILSNTKDPDERKLLNV